MIMRQIKFRAKSIYTNKWVYGNLRIFGERAYISAVDSHAQSEVLLSTVGQFTGLTDCNGKQIYEGDIIKVDELAMPCEVIWYDKTASFQLRYHVEGGFNIPKDALGLWVQDYKSVITVVGNIHDNPELFNEK